MFTKWKTMLALALIFAAVLLGWYWVWGMLFIMWTIPSIATGHTHLVEDIDRDTNPYLFWLIVGTFIALSLYLIVIDLLPLLEVSNV